jgi:uncharacterized Zn-binding protein involved in type VI secretion
MEIIGWIRLGDKAACGGTVIEGSAFEISHGRGYSYQGARMACPKNCVIVDGLLRATLSNGRCQVTHGQVTSGGCPLQSTLNDIDGVGIEAGEAIADKHFLNADGEWAGVKSLEPHEDPYDEQPQLLSHPIGGMPYYVETMDGRTFSGVAGEDGLLPRIATYGEDAYAVYWGDEALAKMERQQA